MFGVSIRIYNGNGLTNSTAVAETSLCPLFTILCGCANVLPLEAMPTSTSIPWAEAPRPCWDTMDLINDRAARMFPGQKE